MGWALQRGASFLQGVLQDEQAGGQGVKEEAHIKSSDLVKKEINKLKKKKALNKPMPSRNRISEREQMRCLSVQSSLHNWERNSGATIYLIAP